MRKTFLLLKFHLQLVLFFGSEIQRANKKSDA